MKRTEQDENEIRIRKACRHLETILVEKSRAYGSSALDPVRIFSDADAEAGLRVRIDDKLSRLIRGSSAGEDTTLDLAGYLVLLLAAQGYGEEVEL